MKQETYTTWQKFKAAAALFILFGGCAFTMALATITAIGGDTHITAGNVALINISDNDFSLFKDSDILSGNSWQKCSVNGYESANSADCSDASEPTNLTVTIGQ